jgi:sugar/nucleoside kinase (ribokinase family)
MYNFHIKKPFFNRSHNKMPYFHLVKKILGVGTALVDVICQVDDDAISKLELSKGSMTLIEESQIQKIRSSFSNPLMTSGGSVCNTVHELNFGSHEASFYGKVNDDEYGNAFIQDLQKANILFQGIMKKNELPTGCCNILVSPDGERTMATHIGIGSQLNPEEINEEILKDIDHIYMESYLWDHDLTKKTLRKFGDMAKDKNIETSLSLSDPFCVDRHRDELKDFIAKNVDLVFCNFDEAKMFCQCETMADVGLFFKAFGKKIVMTSGAEGAFYFFNEEVNHQSVEKVENVLDTTGAGDNFAAGFLDFYLSGKTIDEALKNGNTRAVEVIQQLGPRVKRS